MDFQLSHRPLRILLVEDTELHCEIYTHMIQTDSDRNTVTVCRTGKDAVSTIQKHAESFDCVLLDLHLPDMSGFEVAKEIVSCNAALAIVFITADEDEAKANSAMSVGAQDYLLKSDHSPRILIRSIRYAIERKRFEEEHRRLTDNLAEQKQLNYQQQEFTSLVSHEFRTPIAIISSAVQMLERRIVRGEVEQLSDYTAKIKASVQRLSRLMDTALTYCKLEEGKLAFAPTSCCLQDLIATIAQDFELLYPEMRIQLDCDLLPQSIEADANLLDHAISNIISNALKYSRQHCDYIDVSAREENGAIMVEVKDYGEGMGEQQMARLGQRFVRGSNVHQVSGNGIGIYIAQSMLELHGGQLRYESSVNGGTTATIIIPQSHRLQHVG